MAAQRVASSAETTTRSAHDRLHATDSHPDEVPAGACPPQGLSPAAIRGQTLRVEFRATTEGWLATSFRVDDVSLQ
jgi:hypothetical protein